MINLTTDGVSNTFELTNKLNITNMIQYSNDKEIVRRNDIVIADNNRLAIIDDIVEEDKGIAITFIDNGFQCYIKIKQARFVNHNTDKAAKSYRDLVKLKKH